MKKVVIGILATLLTLASLFSQSGGYEMMGLQFSLYSDFTVYAGTDETLDGSDKVWEPYFEFGQNHFNVMGMASKDNYFALFDISTSARFLELSLQGENSSITFGKIFVPFGSFDYHHIYGGYPDESSIFLPFYWTDYGIKGNIRLNDNIDMDLGVTNGFRVTSGLPAFNSSPSSENNMMKAVNLRFNFYPTYSTETNFSLMYDSFSDEDADILGDSVLLYGIDVSQRLGDLTLKGGGVFSQVFIASDENYYRWGWYGEGSYTFDDLTLRLRAGGMDPDSRELNEEDALNVNGGILVPLGPFEWQTVYLYNIPLGGASSGDTGLSHQVMTKILIFL